MVWLQNILVVLVATAFGFGAGMFAAYGALKSVFPEPRGEAFGSAPVWLAVMALGALLGAIVGFVSAVRWIARQESRAWGPFVWLGGALGGVLSVFAMMAFREGVTDWFWYVCTVFVAASSSAIGGVLLNTVMKSTQPAKKPKSKKKRLEGQNNG